MIATEIGIIFLLLLLNACFALSEIAIVSASKPMLRQMARQGNKRAETALGLAENPGRFLSTVQVGITLVGILAGAYGGATLSQKLAPFFNGFDFINPRGETVAVAVIVTGITYFSVVIGELVPKRFALLHSEKLAMIAAGPMKFLSVAAHPVVLVLEVSANFLMRFLGIRASDEGRFSDEELRAILSEGAESGVIEKSEHEILQRVIRLDDRDVKSIMTHRTEVVFIDINDDIHAVRKKVHEAGHSRYPVIDGSPDELKGIILAKELLDSVLDDEGGPGLNIASHVRDVLVLPESASCLQALESFKKNHINLIVIVDEYGSTQGIVTALDILEAIVGILPSNYDKDDEVRITERADGTWLVAGRTPIEEIHLAIGLYDISADEDFDTIAGFLLEELRTSPKEGVFIEAHGHRFEIVDMDGHRIDKVLIGKIGDIS
ncbi:MAG: hemolysin family protein [Micavibrio sp.]